MPEKITPSPYQTACFNWVEFGSGSRIVRAVAGAGKTWVIEQSITRIPETKFVQLVAFNTAIAKELNRRIEKLRVEHGRPFQRVRASTFHSLGYGAITKRFGKRRIEPNGKKMRDIALTYFTNKQTYAMYGDFCVQLVGFAKGEGIGPLVPNTDDAWFKIIQHHDLYLDDADATEDEAVHHAQEMLALSNKMAENGLIDFDDMLYLPLLWRLQLWQNDWLFVDEAQDTNRVRRALARLALKPGGRSMWVGDPCQAIYGFTGASHDALDIIAREFNCQELPLTISYRCPKAVGELAQSKVPYFEVAEDAIQGAVLHLGQEETLKLLGPHDAILCRNTAPLIEMAYNLIGRGIGCAVLGREIGAGLIALVDKMKAKSFEALYEKLHAYRDREVAKYTGRGEEQKAENVSDRVKCLHTIMDHLDEERRSIESLKDHITSMFSDSNGVLLLATQHKAKGREWRRVAILDPWRNPSKWARQDWQVQQENNLMYVAWTRAQETLIFMDGTSFKKVSLDKDAPAVV